MTQNSADVALKNNEMPLNTNTSKVQKLPFTLRLLQWMFKIGGRISPTIAGRMAYKLWLTPTRFKTPASEQAALQSASIKFHRINDKDIATFIWEQSVTTTGSTGESSTRPTVLLVHGWSGRGTQMGSFVEPLLNAGYRVISFDAPAHGKSTGKQTNLYEISDAILAMQEIYGEFDSVITHSFGGPCTTLAITHGLKVKRFASISPPATVIGLVDKFSSVLQLPAKTRETLLKRIEKTFGNHIWEELAMKNRIKEIDIPGLVIHDKHDTDIPSEEGQAVAHAWNNAAFIKTSGLGHRRVLRDPDVIESTLAFIKPNGVSSL